MLQIVCRLSDRRGNIYLSIASICNGKAIWRRRAASSSQILLGNSLQQFTLKTLIARSERHLGGPKVVLWREKSGWNNTPPYAAVY